MDFAVTTEPFTSIAMLRRFNVWFTINSGNWSDPNTWMSNALDKKNVTVPRAGDIVHIDHNVTLDINGISISELHGNGNLTWGTTNITLTVTYCLNMTGTLTMTPSGSQVQLWGIHNTLASLTNGTNSTVFYDSRYSGQVIMPLTYRHLTVGGSGSSVNGGNVTILGNYVLGSQERTLNTAHELSTFNFSVGGTTNVFGPCLLSKNSSSGTTLFTGMFSLLSGTSLLSFSGNPNVEFRGGMLVSSNSAPIWGTGNMNFTTNNQTIRFTGTTFNSGNFIVGSGVTLTNTSTSSFYNGDSATGKIDGIDGTSVFNNDGGIYILNSTLPMAGHGTFNYRNTPSTVSKIGFYMPGNFTIPYTVFDNLEIASTTGTKTLSGDTTVNQNFNIGGPGFGSPYNGGTLELSSFAFTVTGTSTIQKGTANATLSKNSSTGLILFTGVLTCVGGATNCFNLTGNPNVELRGGMTYAGSDSATNTGTGTWKFTTNNQTLGGGGGIVFGGNVLISGAITLTYTQPNLMVIVGTLNGDNVASTFKNAVSVISIAGVSYYNAQQPMQTGVLDCGTTVGNVFRYSGTNQDITPGTYKNLDLEGGGTKKLLGNVSVTNTYTLQGGTTLNSNGFALTNP